MAIVLVVYHSLSGSTEKMAKAFAEGAKSVPGTEVVLKKASDATLEDLLRCGAIAFGSEDYFSYISGALKDFFDRTFYPSQGKSSSGRESHPPALTEPDVNLSTHPALIVQPSTRDPAHKRPCFAQRFLPCG